MTAFVRKNNNIMIVGEMLDIIIYLIIATGPSGFGSKSTVECILDSLTTIITGNIRLSYFEIIDQGFFEIINEAFGL